MDAQDAEEIWVDIKDAPGYSVSNHGQVRSNRRDEPMTPQVPPKGTVYVALYLNGVQINRSVKVLVADAFLTAPDKKCTTPINKDGDRTNNRVDNLELRPRYYAIQYARQFAAPSSIEEVGPVFVNDSDIMFETVRDAGIHYGVLFKEVYRSIYHTDPVYPVGISFRIPHSIQISG